MNPLGGNFKNNQNGQNLGGMNNLQAIFNSPQMKNVMDMCKGKDPKQVFYDMCGQRGINPDDVLNQLKNFM